MNTSPPNERISRTTRLLAAIVIALVALGITWLVDQWLPSPDAVVIPYHVE